MLKRLICFRNTGFRSYAVLLLCLLILTVGYSLLCTKRTWRTERSSQFYVIAVGKSAVELALTSQFVADMPAVAASTASRPRYDDSNSGDDGGDNKKEHNEHGEDPLISLIAQYPVTPRPTITMIIGDHEHQLPRAQAELLARVYQSITDAGVTHDYASDSSSAGSNTLSHSISPTENCSLVPLGLVGALNMSSTIPSWSRICDNDTCKYLLPGGHYRPPDCIARHRVAIIVPYRDREKHLRLFLHHLHPILQRQQLDYTIFVIEQTDRRRFNRALLMNVGAVEAMKLYDFQCFVFHDVDLLPEDDRIPYSCPQHPRHLSVAVDVLNYRLPYNMLFGGASVISRRHFLQVNGFSNRFWGWGGEDDDMSARLKFNRLFISQLPHTIARYRMLTHRKARENKKRYSLLRRSKAHFLTDGLTSLKYRVEQTMKKQLYTWILADLSTS